MTYRFELPKVSRPKWWIALAFLCVSFPIGIWMHFNGLSFWLHRIDWVQTSAAVCLIVLSAVMFLIASLGRLKDIKAPSNFMWAILILPIWVSVLGFVPSATIERPDPFSQALKIAKWAAYGCLTALAVVTMAYSLRPFSAPEGVHRSGQEDMLKGSDDLERHRQTFTTAANQLIQDGTCKEQDFLDMGGWVQSTILGAADYFTFCDGRKVYVNVNTGTLKRE